MHVIPSLVSSTTWQETRNDPSAVVYFMRKLGEYGALAAPPQCGAVFILFPGYCPPARTPPPLPPLRYLRNGLGLLGCMRWYGEGVRTGLGTGTKESFRSVRNRCSDLNGLASASLPSRRRAGLFESRIARIARCQKSGDSRRIARRSIFAAEMGSNPALYTIFFGHVWTREDSDGWK